MGWRVVGHLSPAAARATRVTKAALSLPAPSSACRYWFTRSLLVTRRASLAAAVTAVTAVTGRDRRDRP